MTHNLQENKTFKVLITVKTYPHPSEKYRELVCTAGVLEDGTFIRLYPIDYRYRPKWGNFKKYNWIQVDATKHPPHVDPRPESYKPIHDTFKILPQHVGTDNNWNERKRYILNNNPLHSMCALNKIDQKEKSLSIIQPKDITKFYAKPTEKEWKGKWHPALRDWLIGPDMKDLAKVPYEFRYKYRCSDPKCKGHDQMIEDWETGILFLKELKRLSSEKKAIESVHEKFYKQICAPNRDTYFFVGTILKRGCWVILGTFYPKIDYKHSLMNYCT